MKIKKAGNYPGLKETKEISQLTTTCDSSLDVFDQNKNKIQV